MPLPSSELWSVLAPSSLNLFSAKHSGYIFTVCKSCGCFTFRMAFSWRPGLGGGVHTEGRERAGRNSAAWPF